VTATENASPAPSNEFKILIATPCYSAECHIDYALSLVHTYLKFQQIKNVKLLHRYIAYDCSIPRARNHFVAFTLADPTIKWQPDDVLKLIQANKPLVAAVLPTKKYYWERLRKPALQDIIKDDTLSPDEFKRKIKSHLVDYAARLSPIVDVQADIIEAEGLPTAFMLIKRELLEKMIASFPARKILNPMKEVPVSAKPYLYSLFEQENIDGEYLSSDYSFCRLWRSLGGKVYADLTINLDHHGGEDFEGDFQNVMKQSQKPSPI
jgi:hypothetical protein